MREPGVEDKRAGIEIAASARADRAGPLMRCIKILSILTLFLAGVGCDSGTAQLSEQVMDETHSVQSDPGTALVEPQMQVVLRTTMGDITLDLDMANAPLTVENFLLYAQGGHYDNTIFHRVISDFVVQGGGFTADYVQKPTYDPVANEADNGLKNNQYTVAMARTSEPHSATSQFFINLNDNSFLDYSAPTRSGWGYAVFGRVTDGYDVVDAIVSVQTGAGGPFSQDLPLSPISILSVQVQ